MARKRHPIYTKKLQHLLRRGSKNLENINIFKINNNLWKSENFPYRLYKFLFSKCRVYLIFSCNMTCHSFMCSFCLGVMICATKHFLRILFHWFYSWPQLDFLA